MHAHQNPSPHLLWKVVEGNLFCIWLSADIQGVGVGVGWGTKMAKLSCCLVRGPGLFICPLPYCGYLPPSLSWNDFHLFPQENMYKAQRSQLLAFWSTKLKVPRSQKLNFPGWERQTKTSGLLSTQEASDLWFSHPHLQAESWDGEVERL